MPGTLNSYRHPSRDQSAFGPKLALSFAPADDWVIKASLGRALRMPHGVRAVPGRLQQRGSAHQQRPQPQARALVDGRDEPGRETAPEPLALTAFAEDTKDSLYSQVNLATNASTVQNVDHPHQRPGVRMDAKEFVAKSLELNTSLTYARSRSWPTAACPAAWAKVPASRAQAAGHGQLTYRHNEAWSVSCAARYSGQQFNQLDNSDVNGFAYQGTSEFFTTDLRVRTGPTGIGRCRPVWTT